MAFILGHQMRGLNLERRVAVKAQLQGAQTGQREGGALLLAVLHQHVIGPSF
ncbi:hypothetical protein F11_10400 [Rhodospirillum rubrum F11]|nr:hypothetical protein F11_10400 [Rhodospirillum rubrum F11]